MKKLILSAVLLATLSGCGVGVSDSGVSLGVGLGGSIGRHVGLGTSINIPLTFDRNKTSTTDSVSNGGINVIENQIVTYFDAQGTATDSAVKGGFFRKLINKEKDGFLVQDFYSTGEKRSDPMLLSREDAFSFRAHPSDGTYTTYAINGNIMQQYNYKKGVVVK
ncbi:NemA protein [Kingella negevensis]|uniref:NemA protein n=1 Tax=Kingella negevensis TaxID=1522312 RepID=A0A238HFM6_9NEIS|nr:NemA protein [Kingella negevensis]MDK4680722.1 NemA protein [Kingella negevensis]MDK4681555.1 NemA protein [Kingella negevensis]MDK4683637.1 NemA protein [Kingella negevensis]MDK4691942.1 NemA protein [Kingella negevensis]MDK4692905.1 NemA protein [Kingella negevensis]